MPEILLESDFITTDLSAVLKNQKAVGSANVVAQQKKHSGYDWGKDLKNRLTTNRQLATGSKESEYDLKNQFFNEFFNNLFNDDLLANRAMQIGDLFRKDIEVLGFSKSTNPIIAFLLIPHVQTTLLKQGLLNTNTYKAIHNALAKNLVADSEWFNVNHYNIIYCADLYRKSASEIEAYLIAQTNALSPSAKSYTPSDLLKNRKAFFYVETVKELDTEERINIIKTNTALVPPEATVASTKLNSIDFVKKFLGTSEPEEASTRTTQKGSKSSGEYVNINALAEKLTDPKLAFAAAQYLSLTTNVPEATKLMQHNKLRGLSAEDIAKATMQVKSLIRKLALSDKETKALVTAILNRLG